MRREIGLGAAGDVGRIGRDGDDLGAAARRRQPVVQAAAALVEADVADLVVDADDLQDAVLGQPLAGLLAGIVFGHGADIERRAHLLAGLLAGVDHHHRDAGGECCLHRLPHGVGVGDRDGDAVRLGGDGGFHQARLLDHVEDLRRVILDRRAGQRRRVVDAALDHRPVGVGGRAVDDEGDADVLRLLQVGGLRHAGEEARRDEGGESQFGENLHVQSPILPLQ